MADYYYEVEEIHKNKHMVRLNTYPQSYASELTKAISAIFEQYKEVYEAYPKWDDAIKVIAIDDDIVLYFEEDI